MKPARPDSDSKPTHRRAVVHALRLCSPWIGVLVLVGAFFLTFKQLLLVLLIFLPVLWLYHIESFDRMRLLRDRNEYDLRMTSVLQTLSEGVLILDGQGEILAVNQAAERVLAYESDELIQKPVEMILPSSTEPVQGKVPTGLLETCLGDGIPVQVEEMPLLGRDGANIPVTISMTPLSDGQVVAGAIVVFQGLLEKKAMQNKLKLMATLDAVTGVPNRWEIERLLSIETKRARRHQRPLSILMVHIDHFKRINDTYGPHHGETVLRAACDVMSGMIRASDSVGRFGTEVFIVILPETTMDNALILAERLREAIAARAVPLMEDRSAYLTISIGAAAFPESGDSIDTLIQAADLALYRAKAKGRNCVFAGRSPSISTGP